MIAFLAVPVQSQTPIPTPPAQLANPTVVAPCGLPASWARFTLPTVTTFNMTADCVVNSWDVRTNESFLDFTSGVITINGNGYSIIGPAGESVAISVGGGSTVLNLNDVTIRQAGVAGDIYASWSVISMNSGRLNARNVIFRDNNVASVLALRGGQAYLENAQFLNNRGTGTGPTVLSVGTGGALLSITNGIFQGNAGFDYFIDFAGDVQLGGCITRADGLGNNQRSGGALTDSSAGECPPGFRVPKKKKKEEAPTAAPTATPRPQIAATHVALQAATGATFRTAFGLDSGVHFRQLDGAGIGVQSIIDAGFLQAFDVYGYVEQGVEVCFPQIGRVLFLDANTSPRAITPLESTIVNGQTCVLISSPGSLALMPSG